MAPGEYRRGQGLSTIIFCMAYFHLYLGPGYKGNGSIASLSKQENTELQISLGKFR